MSNRSCSGIGIAMMWVLAAAAPSLGQAAAGKTDAPRTNAAAAGALARPKSGEDFSTPKLPARGLASAPPRVGDLVERKGFVREFIRLQWRREDPVDIYIVRPKTTARLPVVLLLYGYPSDTRRFLNDDYCVRLASHGFAAVGFDLALNGDRVRGNRPMKEWFVSELDESLSCSCRDVQMVIKYLETRSEFDLSRIGLFGTGAGAAVGVLTASVEPRICALDLFNPWADWKAWMAGSALIPEGERAALTRPAFLARLANLEPVAAIAKLTSCDIRILSLKDSMAEPLACQQKLAKAAPHAQLLTYDNGRAIYRIYSEGRLYDWLGNKVHAVPVKLPKGEDSTAK